jgi:hypothetical protein
MAGLFGLGRQKTAPERTRDALTGNKKVKIKELVGKCEFCRENMDIHQLDIHHIDEACNADGCSDKNVPANLIVICSFCHNEYHRAKTITKAEFRAKVKKRSKALKSKLRALLKDRVIVLDRDKIAEKRVGKNSKKMLERPNNIGLLFGNCGR